MDGPSDPVNLYDDAVIRDPWPHYARLRDLGPVVWMETLGNYAFTQYDTVRNGLRDHETYISSLGAAADDFGCTHQRGNTVASDAPRHTTLRDTISPPLLRDSVETLRPQIQNIADDIVANCMQKGSFEAITDLAQPLPLMLVRDLVGLPDFGRENMLKWASAGFDMQGIQNARGQAARPVIAEMKEFITRDVDRKLVTPSYRVGSVRRNRPRDRAVCDQGLHQSQPRHDDFRDWALYIPRRVKSRHLAKTERRSIPCAQCCS